MSATLALAGLITPTPAEEYASRIIRDMPTHKIVAGTGVATSTPETLDHFDTLRDALVDLIDESISTGGAYLDNLAEEVALETFSPYSTMIEKVWSGLCLNGATPESLDIDPAGLTFDQLMLAAIVHENYTVALRLVAAWCDARDDFDAGIIDPPEHTDLVQDTMTGEAL